MKYALEDKDIKNVAVSGNYGSGKSSFIETYKSKNRKEIAVCMLMRLGLFSFQQRILFPFSLKGGNLK